MTNNKIIRNVIFIISIIAILGVKKCYADILNVEFGSLYEGENGTDTPFEPWQIVQNTGRSKYEYRYKAKITSSANIRMTDYNLNGGSIFGSTQNTIKAGTWIGINITEKQRADWKVYDFQYKKWVKIYTCEYEYKGGVPYPCEPKTISVANRAACDAYEGTFASHYPGSTHGQCTYYSKTCFTSADTYTANPITKEFNDDYTCLNTIIRNSKTYKLKEQKVEEKAIENVNPSADIIKKVEKKAINDAEQKANGLVGASLGNVKYIIDNEYPQKVDDLNYQTIESIPKGNRIINGSGTKNGYVTQEYVYLQEKVCMDIKTAEIKYNSDCGNSEIKIENFNNNGVRFWHYFIPLNTKSTDDFFIQIASNAKRKLTIKECKSAMEKYKSNYVDYIVPEFAENNEKNNLFSMNYDRDINIVEKNNGCYFATTVHIPVEQKFYNEQSDGTFKGFNFYYKPIDVNNPFPNGLPSNSIWTNEKINILKGTNNENITYIANVTNAKAIRDYKNKETNYKKNLYTSWENMHLNGVSDFIENGGFVKRYVQKTDFYKLGCGPANEKKKNSDGTTNYLYQQECGT